PLRRELARVPEVKLIYVNPNDWARPGAERVDTPRSALDLPGAPGGGRDRLARPCQQPGSGGNRAAGPRSGGSRARPGPTGDDRPIAGRPSTPKHRKVLAPLSERARVHLHVLQA